MTTAPKAQACTQNEYHIDESDLPLSCPTAKMRVWDAHPRVYLPIEKTGREKCPYCDAIFILNGFVPQEKS